MEKGDLCSTAALLKMQIEAFSKLDRTKPRPQSSKRII